MITDGHFFFAGGGTGGHIYPAIAVASALMRLRPEAKVHFFCSSRAIDSRILKEGGYDFTPLPARAFSVRPDRFLQFLAMYYRSVRVVKAMLADKRPAVLVGIGGFASAPAVTAAGKLGVPVAMLNVDMVPGKANRVMAKKASKVFVQWEDTAKYLGKTNAQIIASGCPLREGFGKADRAAVLGSLGLDAGRKTLLITGGSSGAQNVNRAVCTCVTRMNEFSGSWQVVHVTGPGIAEVKRAYEGAKITHKVLEYHHAMPELMSSADIVVGRAGAVSVAEYAAAGVAAIMLPYPYHKDQHQRLNAQRLIEAGGGVIVEDRPNEPEKTASELWENLSALMAGGQKVVKMSAAARSLGRPDAADRIAAELVSMMA
ncbi:MAG TPA: UDP-N-acetylglucosamine--N-acetylmuramyl-(pentapeptide) pyrophosphoryl-undecaprenol N-acetylglucosamine transferase [Sedimentisphaerales bacterium]|nr:UDP-N-acetylglucosamine--N-acetylmuramyl-(pentapeptide) pyrophosphoryl-undecaprenol N-acetylglucosamine transferase [Sedimentisphaerales bacterium]